ncbi:MAG: nucleotidyltransferase, partial [Spirochaetia bacterium]|nr:nucleotidyltransferase [Spirochaetia bacterium]
NEKSEFQIPTVVNELLQAGKARVRVLTSRDRWFGVTYREDKPGVVAEIAKLVGSNEYPSPLF